jgi:GAF domain-containing protein
VINSIQQAVGAALDFQGIVDAVGDKLREVFGTGDMSIRWWNEAAGTLDVLYVYEHGEAAANRTTKVAPGSVPDRFLRRRSTWIVGSHAEQAAEGIDARAGTDQARTICAVPLMAGDRIHGGLMLEDHDRDDAFSPSQVRLLETVASSMTVATAQRAQLRGRAAARRRARGHQQHPARHLRKPRLPGHRRPRRGQAARGHEGRQHRHPLVRPRDPHRPLPLRIRAWHPMSLPAGDRFRGALARGHGRPRRHRPQHGGRGGRGGRRGGHRVLAVDIDGEDRRIRSVAGCRGGGELRARICIRRQRGAPPHDHRVEHGRSARERRLFAETQRLFKESEQRSAELSIINAVQQALAGELDIQGVYDAVGDKLREVFPRSMEGIRVVDRAGNRMLYPYAVFAGKRVDVAPTPLRDIGLGAEVIRTGRTLLVNERIDEVSARLGGAGLIAGDHSPRSMLLVPLLVAGQTQAIIVLNDMEREHAFTADDVRLLETLAASMSITLQNARLFDEAQRRTRETAALVEVGRDLSSSLDLSTVMDSIARHAKDLLRAGNSAIFLPVPGSDTYRAIVAVGDIADALRETVVTGGQGIIGSMLVSGKAEYINDTAADSRGLEIDGTEQSRDERLMVVPLGAQGAVEGAMAVWRKGGDPFDDRELEFLTGLSRQATVALRNAHLFDESQRSLARQTATAEILRVISESPTDTQPVFDAIVGTAVRLLDLDVASFVHVTGDSYVPSAHATREGNANALFTEAVPIDASANFPSQALVWKRTVHIPDWDAIELPERQRMVRQRLGVRASLAVPLLRDGEAIGALMLFRKRPAASTRARSGSPNRSATRP